MKALTLHRPWAHWVASGHKRIENRSWKPPRAMLGQVIAIHAGQAWDEDGQTYCFNMLGAKVVEGTVHHDGIIGTAKLVGCYQWNDGKKPAPVMQSNSVGMDGAFEHKLEETDLRWCFGPFLWIFRDAQLLKKTVPSRGYQKLWNVSPEVEAKILEQR